MKTLQIISLVFVIIGALNWGLIGLFNFDIANLTLINPTAM